MLTKPSEVFEAMAKLWSKPLTNQKERVHYVRVGRKACIGLCSTLYHMKVQGLASHEACVAVDELMHQHYMSHDVLRAFWWPTDKFGYTERVAFCRQKALMFRIHGN